MRAVRSRCPFFACTGAALATRQVSFQRTPWADEPVDGVADALPGASAICALGCGTLGVVGWGTLGVMGEGRVLSGQPVSSASDASSVTTRLRGAGLKNEFIG